MTSPERMRESFFKLIYLIVIISDMHVFDQSEHRKLEMTYFDWSRQTRIELLILFTNISVFDLA